MTMLFAPPSMKVATCLRCGGVAIGGDSYLPLRPSIASERNDWVVD